MQGRNGSYNICSQVEGARKFYKCAIKSITKTSLDSSNKKFQCALNIKSQHNTRSDVSCKWCTRFWKTNPRSKGSYSCQDNAPLDIDNICSNGFKKTFKVCNSHECIPLISHNPTLKTQVTLVTKSQTSNHT